MPARLEVIQALRVMDILQLSDGLEFDEDQLLYNEVNRISADDDSVIKHAGFMLLCYVEARFAKLVRKCIFIDLLQKAGPKSVGNTECAADNLL